MNQLGYESGRRGRAVIQGMHGENLPDSIILRDDEGRKLGEFPASETCVVSGWKGREFRTVDFQAPRGGPYTLDAGDAAGTVRSVSAPFLIGEFLEASSLISNLVFGFTAGRSIGVSDRRDRNLPFFGNREDRVDAHGGWYDASGDTSKYLSHLSYANFMNPQQTPLVVWTLLDARDQLVSADFPLEERLDLRLREEAVWGADFLMRMQDPSGYFYMTVFDTWSKSLDERRICAYRARKGILTDEFQSAYRQGGGFAIAALARTSRLKGEKLGDYDSSEYLGAAVAGWRHLEVHNRKYLDDGRENIIDDFCALMAAVELYAAGYKEAGDAAAVRAESLAQRWNGETGCFRADDKGEWSWFHASDESMPLIALMRALETGVADAPLSHMARRVISEALDAELKRIESVVNPFLHPLHMVKMPGASESTRFFYPHENPSGYWWQGENARLASWAAAARRYLTLGENQPVGNGALNLFADAQVSWILGLNPYDACMMQGQGRNNPPYEWDHFNVPGAVANGITSGLSDEEDIAFMPGDAAVNGDHTWRWGEQWIPHAAWLLLAAAWSGPTPTE